jgi:mannose/fructose/N-acetylgalactosamine-specific phosphotransferase system component IIC
MEPLTIVYISCMSVLGIIASTIYCQNSEKNKNINKKNINKKKRFKHYRTH